jgi:phage gpG-like protein
MAGVTVEALLARLQQIHDDADDAAKEAANAMSAVGERAIKQELGVSSHPPGTRTPAAPGMPPSLVTGQLRRSVRQTRLYQTGRGQWTAHVAPTTVYGRIQELGGRAGRHHRSNLPARPYVSRGFLKSQSKARDAAIRVFRSRTET